MRTLDDVQTWGVSPVLWAVLGIAAELHRNATGEELVITSLRRRPGARLSKHAPPWEELCTAADFRRWALDHQGVAHTFCRELQQRFAGAVTVVLEPEWLTAEQLRERGGYENVQPHVHLETEAPGWPTIL